MASAVSPVVMVVVAVMMVVVVVAGSIENLAATGEGDCNAPGLEEIVVPRVDEMNGTFSLVPFVHLTKEHPR